MKWPVLLTPSEFGQCPSCVTGQDIASEPRPLLSPFEPAGSNKGLQCTGKADAGSHLQINYQCARSPARASNKLLTATSIKYFRHPRFLKPGLKESTGHCSSAQLSPWPSSRPHGPLLPGSAPSRIFPLLCAPAVAVVRPLAAPIPLPQDAERSMCFVPGAVFCSSPNGLLGAGTSARNGSKKRDSRDTGLLCLTATARLISSPSLVNPILWHSQAKQPQSMP